MGKTTEKLMLANLMRRKKNIRKRIYLEELNKLKKKL